MTLRQALGETHLQGWGAEDWAICKMAVTKKEDGTQGHLREAEPGFCSGAASAAALLTAGHLQAQGGQRGLTEPAGTLQS